MSERKHFYNAARVLLFVYMYMAHLGRTFANCVDLGDSDFLSKSEPLDTSIVNAVKAAYLHQLVCWCRALNMYICCESIASFLDLYDSGQLYQPSCLIRL